MKSNCTLVLMGLQSFCWDAAKCDELLKVRSTYIHPKPLTNNAPTNKTSIRASDQSTL